MDIRDVITLSDDNKYVIASKINYLNINYYYLADINNPSNLMFCYEDKDELVEVTDKNLITQLLPLFYEMI